MGEHENKENKDVAAYLTLAGVRIEFPYVPYECQLTFMKEVANALRAGDNAALESPTGTGKTLSLLCASLAWLQREKERVKPPLQTVMSTGLVNPSMPSGAATQQQLYPKIYYASRTHSQLKQVVKELNKTRYRSLVKVATLAGRDQLCINEKVIREKSTEIKGHMCRSMVSSCKCHFYNMLEKEGDGVDELYKMRSQGRVMDIEDLVSVAKNMRHCPYYRAKQMYTEADLILLPYTYILDPKTRDAFEIQLRGNVLIFDEAHNLEGVAEESMSVDFSTKTLATAIKECKKVLELLIEEEEALRLEGDNSQVSFAALMDGRSKKESKKKEEDKKPKVDDVATLLSYMQSFEREIDALELEKNGAQVSKLPGRVFPGRRMLELLEQAGIARLVRDAITKLIDKIGIYLAKNADTNSGIWAEKASALGEFANFIAKVLADSVEPIPKASLANKNAVAPVLPSISTMLAKSAASDASQYFKLYVERVEKDPSSSSEIKLHYWCFAAGVAMRLLASRGVRSIVLASGTLSPMQEFITTMAIPFGSVLSSGHAAKEGQLIMGAMIKGPGGHDLQGTFQKRNDLSYKTAIGELVLQTVSSTPQGVLIFFPSYPQMNAFVEHWRNPPRRKGEKHYWAQFEQHKQIFIEPQNKTEVQAMFLQFDTAVREGFARNRGAMMLAVCRGKVSEGIDFADSHCRAVVIVGIPFPPLFDPRVILKKLYLADTRKVNAKAMNPEEWYRVEGIRTVNQAIGRVIRHKEDFGVVVLADSRFATMDTKMFPVWTRGAYKVHQGPVTLFNEIARFFGERGILVRRSHEAAFTSSTTRRSAASRLNTQQQHGKERDNARLGIDELLSIYGEAMLQDKAAEDEPRASNNPSEQRLLLAQPAPNQQMGAAGSWQVSNSTGAAAEHPGEDKSAELDRLVEWLTARSAREKLYPTGLNLPSNARERALEVVSRTTRMDIRKAVPTSVGGRLDGEEEGPAKKRLKLKGNSKIG